MGLSADVMLLGPNDDAGLPAKTLESCRSSLRDLTTPVDYYFKIHRRLQPAPKDFALTGRLCFHPVATVTCHGICINCLYRLAQKNWSYSPIITTSFSRMFCASLCASSEVPAAAIFIHLHRSHLTTVIAIQSEAPCLPIPHSPTGNDRRQHSHATCNGKSLRKSSRFIIHPFIQNHV